jgi:imidazolonepropionase-like amidohydrolase
LIGRRDLLRLAGSAPVIAAAGGLASPAPASQGGAATPVTTIVDARIFDGEWVLAADTVIIEGSVIAAVGRGLAPRGRVINGRGSTLVPGLIDAHTHTSVEALGDALRFGVTTELEMGGDWEPAARQAAVRNDAIADFRSSYSGITPPNGHPAELLPPGVVVPSSDVVTVEDARRHIDKIVGRGADYVKILIEEGTVLDSPGLPQLSTEVILASVKAAHAHGKAAVAHAMTVADTSRAIKAGVDGLTHIFIDRPHTPDLVQAIAASGAFVTPCLTLNASILGGNGKALARDPRVSPKLSPAWLAALSGSMDDYHGNTMENVLATVTALHKAGVDILVGTDAATPAPALGGLAHGASVHDELRLLVAAGLTPIQALRAATSLTARRFDLRDRGRIAVGLRADLVLISGNPTETITQSLSIRNVWKRGVSLAGARG